MKMAVQRLAAHGFRLFILCVIAHPAFAQDALPDGAGKEPTQRICSQCHEAAKAASIKLTRQGWNEEIEKMKALGAQGTEQDFQTILEYLAVNFKGDLDRPLDMNSADAVELESVLGLLRRESAAVLQARARRGPWKTLADLKDLDPAILKKIEAKKDRVVFLTPASKN
jgi:competence protein ComEA